MSDPEPESSAASSSEPSAEPAVEESAEAGGGSGGRGKRIALIAIGVFALIAIGIGVVIATSGGDSSEYDEDTRANFIADCTADGGDPVQPACECWYDAIVEEVSYDRFAEVSDELVAIQAKGSEAEPAVPDDFLELLEPCKLPALAPETTTTTLETPPTTPAAPTTVLPTAPVAPAPGDAGAGLAPTTAPL